MKTQNTQRKTQISVTNFLFHGDDYLFIKRNSKRKIDGGLINGIGGKVESGEDYLQCAIRETKEETGYDVSPSDIKLSAVVRLEGGYEDDWIMCFFKIEVDSKNIPIGMSNNEGDLLWINKNDVLNGYYDLVDDLNYCFNDIVNDKLFFMSAKMDKDEKIDSHTKTYLPIL